MSTHWCDVQGYGRERPADVLDDLPIEAPAFPGNLLREAQVFVDVGRLLIRTPDLLAQPRGDGEPVLVLPGYGAGDGSTWLLRAYLRWLGYDVRGWGIGSNGGHVPALVPLVIGRVIALARERAMPVTLLGWSLGGVIAREAMRQRPDLVTRVVTLGTPVVGGPKYTSVGAAYRRRGYDLDAIETRVRQREAVPLTRPVTAIFSRGDGVVAWRACIDRHNRVVEHVEVTGTHIGLAMNPDVWRIVAQRLAAPARPGR
jgi:pimeloyl-ACP methyl ester carboxylesterase